MATSGRGTKQTGKQGTKQVSYNEVKQALTNAGIPDDKHNEVVGRKILQALRSGNVDLAQQIMATNPPDLWPNDSSGKTYADQLGDQDFQGIFGGDDGGDS